MIRRGFSHADDAFDDALAGRARGPLDTEIQQLVATAELLCRSAVAEPSPEFSASLRARLMSEATEVLVAAPATTTRPQKVVRHTSTRRRRIAGLTAALVAGAGTVGMVSTSATAVPGDALYPVKRGIENVQVALHRDAESRGEYRLQQARERLAEVVALQTGSHTDRITPTLEEFTEQATTGSDELFDAYRADSSPVAVDTVNDFVAAASVELAEMVPDMPEEGVAGWTIASDAVTALADTASSLCQACDVADVSQLTTIVESLATGDAAAPSEGSSTGTDGNGKPSGSTSSDSGSSNPGSSATPAPSGAQPSTSPTAVPTGGVPTVPVPKPTTPTSVPTTVPELLDTTLDGLLGQDGLVPGVVGGLLGQPKP